MTFDLTSIVLPKWPQMLVTGAPVTPEQAKEIIRRTDISFMHNPDGNNKHYADRICKELHIATRKVTLARSDINIQQIDYEKFAEWKSAWGVIYTEYVKNDWLHCAYVHGPYGWCHLDGAIGFIDNVGKWPSISDVKEDWETLVDQFPFLDIGVTLMDKEHCEDFIAPLVSMVVKNGKVEVVSPHSVNVHAGHPLPTRGNKYDVLPNSMQARMEDSYTFYQNANFRKGDRSGENAIPDSWITEWAERFKSGIK